MKILKVNLLVGVDFWRVMGIIFRDDAEAFYDRASRSYRLDDIKEILTLHGIALSDTGAAVRRLKGNASDKYDVHVLVLTKTPSKQNQSMPAALKNSR